MVSPAAAVAAAPLEGDKAGEPGRRCSTGGRAGRRARPPLHHRRARRQCGWRSRREPTAAPPGTERRSPAAVEVGDRAPRARRMGGESGRRGGAEAQRGGGPGRRCAGPRRIWAGGCPARPRTAARTRPSMGGEGAAGPGRGGARVPPGGAVAAVPAPAHAQRPTQARRGARPADGRREERSRGRARSSRGGAGSAESGRQWGPCLGYCSSSTLGPALMPREYPGS
jgi:hypothetical protein